MTYGIRRREDFGSGLRRLIVEDLTEAVRELKDAGQPAGPRIHKARRRLKRARTALAALRPRLGEEGARLAGEIGDLAHRLGPLRDAEVLRSTVVRLGAAAASAAVDTTPTSNRANGAAGPAKIARLLSRTASEAMALPATPDGAALLEHAIRRTYRRGRRAWRAAEASRDRDDLHRWRKRVKDLWHLMLLARQHLPARARKFTRRLDCLAEWIGADHDLVLAADSLRASPSDGTPDYAVLIAERRNALQEKAFGLAGRIYRRKTGAFAGRYVRFN